jgi:hypothetical protein
MLSFSIKRYCLGEVLRSYSHGFDGDIVSHVQPWTWHPFIEEKSRATRAKHEMGLVYLTDCPAKYRP